MCNENRFSESGAPIAPTRCAEYIALKEENARLRAQLEKADALAEQSTARLQSIAASISGILDRSTTADQCMAVIERHVSRTGEKVQSLVAENGALVRERDALRRAEADAEKHKSRRDHFEDLLNRSIAHENEWTKRALTAEAENARLREALKFYANPKKHRLKGEWQHGYPGGIEYQDGRHSMLDTGQIASNALKEVG